MKLKRYKIKSMNVIIFIVFITSINFIFHVFPINISKPHAYNFIFEDYDIVINIYGNYFKTNNGVILNNGKNPIRLRQIYIGSSEYTDWIDIILPNEIKHINNIDIYNNAWYILDNCHRLMEFIPPLNKIGDNLFEKEFENYHIRKNTVYNRN